MRTRVRSGFLKKTLRGVSVASSRGGGGATWLALALGVGRADATGTTGFGLSSPQAASTTNTASKRTTRMPA